MVRTVGLARAADQASSLERSCWRSQADLSLTRRSDVAGLENGPLKPTRCGNDNALVIRPMCEVGRRSSTGDLMSGGHEIGDGQFAGIGQTVARCLVAELHLKSFGVGAVDHERSF